LNPTTGAATLIGPTGKGNVEGLDFNGSTLLGVTFNSTPTVFSINTGTGATTDIMTAAGSVGGSPRAMAVLNANTVYLAAGANGYDLYSMNLSTGAVALIGTIGSGGQLAGLDLDTGGNLYALDTSGSEFLVNQGTGVGTPVGSNNGLVYLDLAIQGAATGVPEPATMAMLGMGLAVLMLARSRMRARG
jgi:hypothetical protein